VPANAPSAPKAMIAALILCLMGRLHLGAHAVLPGFDGEDGRPALNPT
jgi:hypothetical protein